MDWDADPSPFNECVTIVTGVDEQPASFEKASDDGFASSNPLIGLGQRNFDCNADECLADCTDSNCDNGSADHGAAFQFLFKDEHTGDLITLESGESHTFTIFYGAAPNKAEATTVLADAGAEVSGEPSMSLPYNVNIGLTMCILFSCTRLDIILVGTVAVLVQAAIRPLSFLLSGVSAVTKFFVLRRTSRIVARSQLPWQVLRIRK